MPLDEKLFVLLVCTSFYLVCTANWVEKCSISQFRVLIMLTWELCYLSRYRKITNVISQRIIHIIKFYSVQNRAPSSHRSQIRSQYAKLCRARLCSYRALKLQSPARLNLTQLVSPISVERKLEQKGLPSISRANVLLQHLGFINLWFRVRRNASGKNECTWFEVWSLYDLWRLFVFCVSLAPSGAQRKCS